MSTATLPPPATPQPETGDLRAERSQKFRTALAEAQEAFDGVDLRRIEAELYDEKTGLPQ